jgi:hypothetical protein
MMALAATGQAQTTLLTESFENGGGVPAGWSTQVVSGSSALSFTTSTSWPPGYTAVDGSYLVTFGSFSYITAVNRLLMTSPASTVGYTGLAVDFQWLESTGFVGTPDRVDVEWSTDGVVWNSAETIQRYNPVQGWKTKTVLLPAGAEGQATLYLAFLFTSAWGYDCYLDLVHLTGAPEPTPTPTPPPVPTVGDGGRIWLLLLLLAAGATALWFRRDPERA